MDNGRIGGTWIGLDIDDKWTHGYALGDDCRIIESKRVSTPEMEWLGWVKKFPEPRHVMFEESTLAQWFFAPVLAQ